MKNKMTYSEIIEKSLSPSELSERWGMSVSHLANMRCQNIGMPYIKIRNKIRYWLRDIEKQEAAWKDGKNGWVYDL